LCFLCGPLCYFNYSITQSITKQFHDCFHKLQMQKLIHTISLLGFIALYSAGRAQEVNIQIDATSEHNTISPYKFGENNNLSDNPGDLMSENEWRSSLYPENWKPGYKDSVGRFLHDFSYAGYHKAEKEIPYITENIVDITKSPYNADNTSTEDVTSIIQQALDDVGTAGGGVVYLPTGTYRIKTPAKSPIGSSCYILHRSQNISIC